MIVDAAQPVPRVYDRVLVAGISGSGKTSFARRIAERWAIPHTELDSLFHGPGWTQRPEFFADVAELASGERWITEWQYLSLGGAALLEPRAELAVWLDYPYGIARRRLIRRTFDRLVRRTELWNGNREGPLRRVLSRDPEQSILSWQSQTRDSWRKRMPAAAARNPELRIVRLAHPREAERWLAALPARTRCGRTGLWPTSPR